MLLLRYVDRGYVSHLAPATSRISVDPVAVFDKGPCDKAVAPSRGRSRNDMLGGLGAQGVQPRDVTHELLRRQLL